MSKKTKKIRLIAIFSVVALCIITVLIMALYKAATQLPTAGDNSPTPLAQAPSPTPATASPSPVVSPTAKSVATKKLVPTPSPSSSPSATPDLDTPQKEATSYTLTPAENPKRIHISSGDDSRYAYVILKNQDGEIVRNQSNVIYEWNVARGDMLEYNLSRSPGYPCYPLEKSIKQPCPAFGAIIKAHFPGETSVTVTASIPGKGIVARTAFKVEATEWKPN